MKKFAFLLAPLMAITFLTNCGGPKKFTVTFDPNGGTSVPSQTVEENKCVAKPDNPIKNGYTFGKWCTDEALTSEYDFSNLVTSNFTLYAKYSPVDYTINYHMPDGATHTNPTSYTIESEDINLTNASVNKKGYEPKCNGWHIGSVAGELITKIPKGSTGNLELYTSETAVTYTINYHMPDGATHTNPTSYTIETNDITLTNPTGEGYTFNGWRLGSASGELITKIPKGTTGNLDLYAYGTADTYTINYHMPDGATHANPTSYNVESDDITLTDATKKGYTFNGWHIGSVTGELITKIPKGSTGNLELYTSATVINYTINYSGPKGFTHSNPTSYNVESEDIILQNAYRAGYIFDGWRLESEAGQKITKIPKGTTGNIDLYAISSLEFYTITYKNVVESEHPGDYYIFSVRSDPIILSTPKRENWTFGGWYTDSNFAEVSKITTIPTGTTGNLVLYAKMIYCKNLENCSWEEIKMVCDKGGPRGTFGNPGEQTKKVIVNGNENQVRIVAYGYDKLSTSTEANPQYAGITFEFVNVISGFKTYWNNKQGNNSKNNNFVNNSNLNDCLQSGGTLYNMMPSDLMNVVKTVNKKIEIYTNNWIETEYSTKLFPLSKDEIDRLGDNPYEYYKLSSRSERAKDAFYWLRSPAIDGNSSAWNVVNEGFFATYYVYADTRAVAPAFCI